MQTESVRDIFDKFDKKIHHKLKLKDYVYAGDKPNPEDWSDLLEEDDDFKEEFQSIYNDKSIPEAADDFFDRTYQIVFDG